MEITPSIYVGGLYRSAPIEHLNSRAPQFADLLARYGVQISKNLSDASVYLGLDVDVAEIEANFQEFLEVERRVLLRQEPRVVRPQNYKVSLIQHFDRVIDVGRIESSEFSTLLWPQIWRDVNFGFNKIARRKDSVVMIASNRLSLVDGEQYSLRRKCIKEIDELHVFGNAWSMSLQARMKQLLVTTRDLISSKEGPNFLPAIPWLFYSNKEIQHVESKHETLSKWQASLVIENTLDVFTEKLFDSFFAFTIPIYIGPQLFHYPIPSELYIQAEPNMRSIKCAIDEALSFNYEKWRTRTFEWLSDPLTKETWSWESFAKKVVSILNS